MELRVDAEQIKDILELQGKYISEENLNIAEGPRIKEELLRLVSATSAMQYQVIPYSLSPDGEVLTLLTYDTSIDRRIDELSKSIHKKIEIKFTTRKNVEDGIALYYQSAPIKMGDVSIVNDNAIEITAGVNDKEIVGMINQIISEGIGRKATDIHFIPKGNGILVQYRVDGDLEPAKINIPGSKKNHAINRLKYMSNGVNIGEHKIPQDGRFAIKLDDKVYEFRVGVLPTMKGEKVSLRILNQHTQIRNLEELGFQKEGMNLLKEVIDVPYGLIIVAGPTGSGKSTTITACMKKLYQKFGGKKLVYTLEDPVENEVHEFIQCQVSSHQSGSKSLTFEAGLRALMRNDPDIIQIGEIRDEATAVIAIQAASTGHKVFTTVHTGSAATAVSRILGLGADVNETTANITAVLAQRLARKNCPHCAKEMKPEKYHYLSKADQEYLEGGTLRSSIGCSRCGFKKSMGRTVIYEILPFNDSLRDFLIQNSQKQGEIQEYIARNIPSFVSMWKLGLSLVRDGVISLDELLEVINIEREEEDMPNLQRQVLA